MKTRLPGWSFIAPLLIAVLLLSSCGGSGSGAGSVTTGGEIPSSAELEGRGIGPDVGKMAPGFTAVDLKGNKVTLANLRGKVVLLNLWATWCPYCKQELPDMQQFYEAYKARGIEVVAVDVEEDANTVHSYINGKGFTFPIWLDLDAKINNAYGVSAYPTSFFIDREGVIQSVQIGAMDRATMEQNALPLLSK
ncbi:MAG: redoxin domain-containing protein [Chloroflexi bacterium]|nr:redoxin domain-containing protein [Chloroflexota bacterium]